MSRAVETRILIAGGATAILVGSLIYWLVQVRPISLELSRLRTQILAGQQAKQSAQATFDIEKSKMGVATAEIQRLRLFDLRAEKAFDRVFASRSNVGLIAFGEIFQNNTITVDLLTPTTLDTRPIYAQGAFQGGVLRQRYRIHGTGLYQNVLKAFEAIKTFPPVVDVERYSLKYEGTTGTQARVSFDMTVGFNFLVSMTQLAEASASAKATPSIAFESLDDFVLATPSTQASPSANGLLSVPFPGAPQNLIQNLQQLAPPAPGGKVGWAKTWMNWLDPMALAAPATGTVKPAAAPTPPPYLFNVGKATTLGRAEPFLPLGNAAKQIAPLALLAPPLAGVPTVNLLPPAIVVEPPETQATLMAVLLSNNRPANALLQYGGTRSLVHQGTVLEGGDQVVTIGRDFILIRHKKALRRVELRSIGASPTPPAITTAKPDPPAPKETSFTPAASTTGPVVPAPNLPTATPGAAIAPALPPLPPTPRLPN